jgi:glycerophosphoryl diester phosphodiesterase
VTATSLRNRPLPQQAPAARQPLVIAHRGFSHVAPENTAHAVHRAAAACADAVEIDVQRTRDGHLVAIHDRTFRRTTDIATRWPGRADDPVESFTLAEIRRLDAGTWKHPNFAGVGVPTLREVLDVLRGTDTGLLIELKEPGAFGGIESDLTDVLDTHPGGRPEDVTVQSFDAETLHTFARLRPSYRIGLLTLSTPLRPQLVAWAGVVNPWHRGITETYVRRARLAGLQTYAWTVNEEQEMLRLARAGVDALLTDRPDLARQALLSEPCARSGHVRFR